MALNNGLLWEMHSTATTGNVNGAGFDPANANFLTDLTTDTNTGNTASPVVSSATYNFVAGDVGAYVYIKSGTNSIPGFYPIVSVASNKATLNAAIGSGEVLDSSTGMYKPSTVVGIATVGTPTNLTYGVDYSRLDTAPLTKTDLTCTAGSTTVTSATATFTKVMVGNMIHLTALTGTGAIVGWYMIVSYTSGTSVVLDRTPTNGVNNITAGTYYVGGAGRLNGLEDAFYEQITAGNFVYIKGSGTHSISGNVAIASTLSTAASPSWTIGYTTVRGDTTNGTNRPTLAFGASTSNFGQYQNFMNIITTVTTSNGLQGATGSVFINCYSLNSSTAAARTAINLQSGNTKAFACEAISQNGRSFAGNGSNHLIVGCYAHDSDTGHTTSANGFVVANTVFEAMTTVDSNPTNTGPFTYINNTFYGSEAKLGTGLNFSNAAPIANFIQNCIFYGLVTGYTVNTRQDSNIATYNNYFNNTTDVTNVNKSSTDLAIDPKFARATQITGTTATTSGSVLTQSGGDFSTVTDNVDFLHVTSGTGVTTGIYLITSHTSTTLTVNNALGTSSAGNVVYFVTTGHNFAIGAALNGFPGAMSSTTTNESTGYIKMGALQPAQSGGFFIQ